MDYQVISWHAYKFILAKLWENDQGFMIRTHSANLAFSHNERIWWSEIKILNVNLTCIAWISFPLLLPMNFLPMPKVQLVTKLTNYVCNCNPIWVPPTLNSSIPKIYFFQIVGSFILLKHKTLCCSWKSRVINCLICLFNNWFQWNKQVLSLSTILTIGSPIL